MLSNKECLSGDARISLRRENRIVFMSRLETGGTGNKRSSEWSNKENTGRND